MEGIDLSLVTQIQLHLPAEEKQFLQDIRKSYLTYQLPYYHRGRRIPKFAAVYSALAKWGYMLLLLAYLFY